MPAIAPDIALGSSSVVSKGKASLTTRIIQCQHQRLNREDLEFCAQVIDRGGLVIFPTDTVYGVGCNAFNPAAVKKIYSLKGRSYTKALPILLGHRNQLPLVAMDAPPESFQLTKAYWPGPLTMVFKTAPLAMVASRGKSTIAVRVPDHGVALGLLKSVHVPLATTSANASGKPSITQGAEAVKIFQGRVDVIIDGGMCEWRRESSVVDATHFPFTILREGAISKSDLAKQLNLA